MRIQAFREETRLHKAMSSPTSNELVEGVYLACWSFFPLLLETHRSLLRRIRFVRSVDPTLRPHRVLTILVEAVPHIAAIHQAYAMQFQTAARATAQHTTPSDLVDVLKSPLTALDACTRCLHGLHSISSDVAAVSAALALLDSGMHQAFESMHLRLVQRLDIENKVPHVEWTNRVLVDVAAPVQVANAQGQFVDATMFLFEGVLVAQSVHEGSILLTLLADTSPISIVHATDSAMCVVLGATTACHVTFASTDACRAWLVSLASCFTARFQSVFSFDLHALLASMQQFPKSWLVADTDTANHDLVASAAMWLMDLSAPSAAVPPRLHQVYLMRDMVLYGRITSLSTCEFGGYILGEHVTVHDTPSSSSAAAVLHVHAASPFEVEITPDDGGDDGQPSMSQRRLLLAPVDPSVRQEWVELLQQLKADVVGASDESQDLYYSPSHPSSMVTSSHTTMATSSEGGKHESKSTSEITSNDQANKPTPVPETTGLKPAARMLEIDDMDRLPTSDTEIESGDDDGDSASLDSMLCAKNPRKRSFAQIHSPSPTRQGDERLSGGGDDTSICAETPDAVDHKSRLVNCLAQEASPPSKRAIAFACDSVDDTTSQVSIPQDKEGGKAIPCLASRHHTAIASSVITPEVPAPPFAAAEVEGTISHVPATRRPSKPHKKTSRRTTKSPTNACTALGLQHTAKVATSSNATDLSDGVPSELPPSTQEMEGGALQFLRDVPFASKPSDDDDATSIRIALSGFDDPTSLFSKIAAIRHAEYEDDVGRATHIVAPSGVLKRTVKILCGISSCDHILDEEWLHASAKLGRAAPEVPFCLSDPAKEARWGCSLQATMYDHSRVQRQRLLAGRAFFVTRHKTVLPPPQDLERIIVCAAADVGPDTIVITSVEAAAAPSIQKILKRVDRTQCYTPELLLRCILTQKLSLNEYHVGLPDRHEKKATRKKYH
ncbi:hypothetical protein B5M09_002953 [Aphanomyces astaci]|uniref:BRCT domain-containing protein n=1 Tax=Aphanomyces astaci TaxID=112090 RepID=A0A425D993_APHAT|nr:hypothetical protein B5M09_002953 [Aphanomyces astaci]